jgi:hypothetical protein
LESRWETRLAALTEAQAALATAQAAKPASPATTSLQALAQDLPRLWHAETTSPRDRKRLLRSLVADVTLLPEPDARTMRIGVRWHTGATDELAVARPGPAAAQRTMVHPLGSRHPGGLPAESRRLVSPRAAATCVTVPRPDTGRPN